jgi:hypothetical protein
MNDQLGLDLAAVIVRCYDCCGLPCGPLSAPPDAIYPHAQDCSNPNVGTWIHRETGWTIRRLHCGDDVVAGRKPCPHNGRFARLGVFDPHDGACCLTLRAATP